MLLHLILLMHVCMLQNSDMSAPTETCHSNLYPSLGIVMETKTVQGWKIQSATALDNPQINL